MGLEIARDRTDADWVMAMDDGRPEPGAFDAFRAMDLTGWEAIGAAVFHPGGNACKMNRPYCNPLWTPGALPAQAGPDTAGTRCKGFTCPMWPMGQAARDGLAARLGRLHDEGPAAGRGGDDLRGLLSNLFVITWRQP